MLFNYQTKKELFCIFCSKCLFLCVFRCVGTVRWCHRSMFPTIMAVGCGMCGRQKKWWGREEWTGSGMCEKKEDVTDFLIHPLSFMIVRQGYSCRSSTGTGKCNPFGCRQAEYWARRPHLLPVRHMWGHYVPSCLECDILFQWVPSLSLQFQLVSVAGDESAAQLRLGDMADNLDSFQFRHLVVH